VRQDNNPRLQVYLYNCNLKLLYVDMKILVYLNVYDLHHANSYGYPLGLGAFHTGVEIGDKEYAYGGHEYNFTGVYESTPKAALGAIFRESVLLGETSLSKTEIQNVVNQLAVEYVGNGYHPFTRNCNTFSNDLSLRLLNKSIPSYINRLPYLGTYLSCIPLNTLLSVVGLNPPTGEPIETIPTVTSPRASDHDGPFFVTSPRASNHDSPFLV